MSEVDQGSHNSEPNNDENGLTSFDDQKDSKNAITHSAKWINNEGEEVEEVFGFNKNAELVNGRAAMIGFLMLILTELAYKGEPVTKGIFGIG